MKKTKGNVSQSKTIGMLVVLLAAQSTLTYAIKRYPQGGAAFNHGEGIPIGLDKTKLGKLVMMMTPTYWNILVIWNFENFKTSDPANSDISNPANQAVKNSVSFSVISSNMVVYTHTSPDRYTVC